MTITLRLEPACGQLPPVDYHWDSETEILSARLRTAVPPVPRAAPPGAPQTVEVCGRDGSWLMLDVQDSLLHGMDVAVWPPLSTRGELRPPPRAGAARARVLSDPPIPASVDTVVAAESDQPARTLHFRVGRVPVASTVRLGGDLLLDLDADSRLAGLWLLNVPPSPTHA